MHNVEIVHSEIEKITNQRFNKTIKECNYEELEICIMDFTKKYSKNIKNNEGDKKIYYVSAEFLIGKLLTNNLINFGLYDYVSEALKKDYKDLSLVEEKEKEPSLGNGGLGRLATCFLDSIVTLGLNGAGCGLRYHLGLFRQIEENNKQKEIPDPWIDKDSWLNKTSKEYRIHFGYGDVTSKLYTIDVIG